MAGFEIDIINIIVDNLRDRYKSGFPVLKEIIQNADDAASQKNRDVQLDFGFTEGLPGAKHPLLKGPALFFLNNGSFTEQDARAVKSFALNSKAADSGAIGKFGLGMKSVFHFCESFFWLAQDGELKWEEIQNPWSGNLDYPAPQTIWDNFPENDADGIRVHLKDVFKNVCKQYNSYFLLWIPLRQKRHLIVNEEEVGSIISEFPGDNRKQIDFLFQSDLPNALAELLPLLRHLTSINFWNANKGNSLYLEYIVQLRDGAKRNSYPRTKNLQPLSGIVSYKNQAANSPQQSIQFAGFEGRAAEIKLKDLRNSAYWPKSYVRDNLGRVQPEPDKAKGHCAVTFSRTTKKTKGKLNIQWAVFLPLESSREECNCKSEFSYSLTLHGFFFVDAGRVTIEGLGKKASDLEFPPQSENELRRAWNHFLLTRGTFLLLIPALSQFVKQVRISLEETSCLCEAIKGSSLFINNRRAICQVSQWVLQVVKDGPLWLNVDPNQKILPIPAPPQKTPNRPWEVFPRFADLEDKFIFVQKNAPHLTHLPIPQWSESTLQVVLVINPRNLFTNQSSVNYFNTFLNDDSIRPFLSISTLQHLLKELIRKGFKELGSQMSSVTTGIQEIVSHVLPEQKYILSNEAPDVIRKLQSAESDYLILHKIFDNKDNPGNAKLSVDAALEILTNLDHQLRIYEAESEEKSATKCREIILEVLKKLDRDTRRKILQKGKNLKIITGYNCKLGRHSAFTTKELRDCQKNSCLFLYTQGINLQERLGLSANLQSILAIETIILITSEMATIVFDTTEHGLYQCLAEGCLTALGINCKELKENVDRGEIIGSVSGVDLHKVGPELIRGFRYLLHGDKNHFYGNATLWVQRYKQNPVWSKLWKQLASSAEDNILVQRNLAEKIPQDNRWQILGLREIDQQGILEDIRAKGTEFIETSSFSEDERTEVLLSAQHDCDLWKRLPLHKTVEGTFVSISELAFLEPPFIFPNEILKTLHIIKKSLDIGLKRLQADQDYILPLTDQVLIQNLLDASVSYNFNKFILDSLSRLNGQLSIELRERLRNERWLFDNQNTPLSPSDVICLPGIQDEVSRLISAEPGSYWQPESLAKEIKEQPFYNQLEEKFFSHGVEGLKKLALLLEQNSDYAIGCLTLDSDSFVSMLNIFGNSSYSQHLPGWRILQAISDNFGIEKCSQHILPSTLQHLPIGKVNGVLSWLVKQHQGTQDTRKYDLFACHIQYLKIFTRDEIARDFLANLQLLNQLEEWKSAKRLCCDVEGIAPKFLLDKEQRDCLLALVSRQNRAPTENDPSNLQKTKNKLPERRDLSPDLADTVCNLSDYFKKWEALVPPETICGLLSILGNDSELLELSTYFQGRHSVEGIRYKIPWKVHYNEGPDGRKEWLYGYTLSEALNTHRFIVELVSGQEVVVTSLIGEDLSVALNDSFTSFLLGKPFYECLEGDTNFLRIKLRKVDESEVTPDQFIDYLKATAEYILREVYTQNNHDLSSLWDELSKSEQLDVRIALRLVMKHIPFYLDQLGVHKNKLLKNVYNSWNEARYNAEEYRDIPEQLAKYQQKEEACRQKIQDLIENDPDVQSVVLSSVRHKMRDFQYTERSIPFELYQNADDAVVENLKIARHPDPIVEIDYNQDKENDRFVVKQGNETVQFMHWGRPINSTGAGGFPGREYGYHQDLEKMLILSSSNKSSEKHLTGKFGLGFKSVLLACDKPRFISGRLGVEIIAGLYPKPLNSQQTLRNELTQFSTDSQKLGTLIELGLSNFSVDEILGQFHELAGVLTIFSKKIRRIDFAGKEIENENFEWLPEIALATSNIHLEIGSVTLWDNDIKRNVDAVHFRCSQGGGLLIGSNGRGFTALPGELPPVWVVSPSREKGRLGFCINGKFEIDAGRARLAGESGKNRKEAQRIGRSVGDSLCLLFDETCNNWDATHSQFRLLPETTLYMFWESIWETLTHSWVDPSEKQLDSEVFDVVSNLLSTDAGLGLLLKEKDALPNGLWGNDFERLINPNSIRYVLRDSLSDKNIFVPLAKWQLLKKNINPTTVISARIFPALGKILPGFTQKKDQWQSLRLSQVINWLEEYSYRVDLECADILGGVITKQFLEKLQTTREGESEHSELMTVLKKLRFEAHDGGWYLSSQLLRSISSVNADEEPLRARFAPKRSVLLEGYSGAALDFYIVCRGEMSAKTDTMAQWILDSETSIQKTAALWYLVKGELGDNVAYLLRFKGTNDTWLSSLRYDSEYFEGWNDEDIKELLFRKLPSLSDLERWGSGDDDYNKKTNVIEPVDVPKTLENIYKWWSENSSDYLNKYESITYPDTYATNSLSNDDRSAWLTMLMLGSFHTFGRAKPEQHRNFLTLCNRKGWWEIFSRRNPKSHSDDWMGILEDFIDDQSEDSKFEYWMRLFPTIYKFALDVEEYVELFYSLETQGKKLDVKQTMAPRTFSEFQGGGITAAPIARTLGMGVTFVLREMMRKNLFRKNCENISPYCYVPLGRVRNLFSKMGCQDLENGESHLVKSEIIYEFLCEHIGSERADFAKSFDIPFQFIAEDLGLQEQLFT